MLLWDCEAIGPFSTNISCLVIELNACCIIIPLWSLVVTPMQSLCKAWVLFVSHLPSPCLPLHPLHSFTTHSVATPWWAICLAREFGEKVCVCARACMCLISVLLCWQSLSANYPLLWAIPWCSCRDFFFSSSFRSFAALTSLCQCSLGF